MENQDMNQKNVEEAREKETNKVDTHSSEDKFESWGWTNNVDEAKNNQQ